MDRITQRKLERARRRRFYDNPSSPSPMDEVYEAMKKIDPLGKEAIDRIREAFESNYK